MTSEIIRIDASKMAVADADATIEGLARKVKKVDAKLIEIKDG